MVEKYDKESEDITSGNWNIAGSYTKEMILRFLLLISEYEVLSIFGYSKIEGDIFMRDKNLQNSARLHAMKRLLNSIVSLIRNTKFAILKKDRLSFNSHIKRLLLIEKNLYRLRLEKKRGGRLVELNIDEKLFDKMVDEINFIKDDINDKLNLAGLIFTPKEEYDTKKIKEGFKNDFINR